MSTLTTRVGVMAAVMSFVGVVVTSGQVHASVAMLAFQTPFPCDQQIRMESFGHAPALDIFRVPNSETEGNPLIAPAAGVVNKSYSDPIDRNGDNQAEWGHPNNERVPPVFNGVAYGQANGQTWYVTSRNCGGPRFVRDVTGNGWDDIVGRAQATGELLIYDGFAPGKLASPEPRGTGWGAMTSLLTGDFTGDSHGDLIGKRSDGNLFLYAGYADGRFSAPEQVGTGWQAMNTVVTADFNADGRSDLMARRDDGFLFLYTGYGRANFSAPQQAGTGWGGMTAIVGGDFNGDGKGDLVGRAATGDLNIYAGRGNGQFDAPRRIGNGWNGITALIPGDFTHDGRTDIAGRAVNGDLLLYVAGADGVLSGGSRIGTGWNGLDLFQS
ncbi:FG-GAP repeat domain-containing protein [Kibdelosporangium aridum]|nr:VCBS repeat-containing protein [Kibdelosporangium aridum]